MNRTGEKRAGGGESGSGRAQAVAAVGVAVAGRIIALGIFMAVAFFALFASDVRGEEASGDREISGGKEVSGDKNYVTDMAELLTENQEEELRRECGELAERYAMDFVIVTTQDKGGKTVFDYVYDFYMDNGYGYDGPGGDGFALLIDMEDRNVYILSRGQAPRWISNQTLTDFCDGISGYLADGDFARGCGMYLERVSSTLDDLGYRPGAEPEEDMTLRNADEGDRAEGRRREGQRFSVWSRLLGALIFGAVTTGIAVYCMKGTDNNTSVSRSYLKGQARIADSRDVFVNRTQTRTPKPKQNSGGSSGGDSFGGHFDSHTGGGGSKF